MDTMKDKEFLAEAEKAQLEITPIDGVALQKLVAEVYKTPPEIAKEAGRRAEVASYPIASLMPRSDRRSTSRSRRSLSGAPSFETGATRPRSG